MISSIINREFLNIHSVINIGWTPCDSPVFELFIKDSCSPCNLISLTQTYYGMNDISLIICNNRLTHLNQSIELAKFFFCPLLVIDHAPKPDIVTNKPENDISISPLYQIAISKDIFLSWNKIQNSVLQYDINNHQSKNVWKNMIFQLCKSNLVVKDEQITQTQKN